MARFLPCIRWCRSNTRSPGTIPGRNRGRATTLACRPTRFDGNLRLWRATERYDHLQQDALNEARVAKDRGGAEATERVTREPDAGYGAPASGLRVLIGMNYLRWAHCAGIETRQVNDVRAHSRRAPHCTRQPQKLAACLGVPFHVVGQQALDGGAQRGHGVRMSCQRVERDFDIIRLARLGGT